MRIELGLFHGNEGQSFRASIGCDRLIAMAIGIVGRGYLHILGEASSVLCIDDATSEGYAILENAVGAPLAKELWRDLVLFNAKPYYAVNWTLTPGIQKVYFTLDLTRPVAYTAETRPIHTVSENFSHPLWDEKNSKRIEYAPHELALFLTADRLMHEVEHSSDHRRFDDMHDELLARGYGLCKAAQISGNASRAIAEARETFAALIDFDYKADTTPTCVIERTDAGRWVQWDTTSKPPRTPHLLGEPDSLFENVHATEDGDPNMTNMALAHARKKGFRIESMTESEARYAPLSSVGARMASFAWWYGIVTGLNVPCKLDNPPRLIVVDTHGRIYSMVNGASQWLLPEDAYIGDLHCIDKSEAHELIAHLETEQPQHQPYYVFDHQLYAGYQCWDTLKTLNDAPNPVIDEALRQASDAMHRLGLPETLFYRTCANL